MKKLVVSIALLILFSVCALVLFSGRGIAGTGSIWKNLSAELFYKSKFIRSGHNPSDLDNYSIGQSHIDAAWLWRVDQTKDKCIKTFGNAVKHMEMFPDFHYSQSAPQYYEWIMQDDPELFEKIKYYEKKGQWEIVGGQWVEPDNNMPDGESFVRQRLYGMRFYQEHFGHTPDISWLLDSFGYQWNLPQILSKSGAKYFWTNKLTWNDTTIFPFHLFWWQSPDGSRVLAYFCQHAHSLPYPNGEITKYHDTHYLLPNASEELIANYSTSPLEIKNQMTGDWLNVVGIFYGKGDGGHGPTLGEIERQQHLISKGYTKFATAKELYAKLDAYKDSAPVWNDELYLEYHRGTLTTQAQVKRSNRESEQLMRTAEVLQSFASRKGLAYSYERLKAAWKLVLLNQFHDILPGTSIPEVYEDSRIDYENIKHSAITSIQEGKSYLAQNIDTSSRAGGQPVVVFNTLSWDRSGAVEIKYRQDEGKLKVVDQDGKDVPSQYGLCNETDEKCFFFRAEDVPSMGYKVYFLKAGDAANNGGGPNVDDGQGQIKLSNDLVSLTMDKKTGWLTSVKIDKDNKELLSGYGNQLMAWKDSAANWPAWNIMKDYLDHPREMPDAKIVRISNQGPLFAEVTSEREIGDSRITQIVRLYRDDPAIRLTTRFDFHESNTIVKSGFDSSIKADKVAAEISYAVIERPTHPRTPAEKAQWETLCQRWIDLSDGEHGLALLNNGKYGYSLNEDGTGYRLTMLKAAQYPNSANEAVNVDDAGLPRSVKKIRNKGRMTDQGPHTVWTALLPHKGDWKQARLWQAGYEFNTPFQVERVAAKKGELPALASFVSVDNPDIYIGAVKRAEDGDELVIRLVEAIGSDAPVTVKISHLGQIASMEETDLLEWNPKPVTTSGHSFTVNMKPHEIKTIKVGLK